MKRNPQQQAKWFEEKKKKKKSSKTRLLFPPTTNKGIFSSYFTLGEDSVYQLRTVSLRNSLLCLFSDTLLPLFFHSFCSYVSPYSRGGHRKWKAFLSISPSGLLQVRRTDCTIQWNRRRVLPILLLWMTTTPKKSFYRKKKRKIEDGGGTYPHTW